MRNSITLTEAAVVSAICFGMFIAWSTQSVLSGFPRAEFSDDGNFWLILVELMLGTAALLYLRTRDFDIRSLYPEPSLRGTLLGLGLFVAAWIAGAIATAPFVDAERPQITEFSYGGVSLVSSVLFAMVNGTFEEIFLLGVLVRGLRGYGLPLAIGISLLVRVLYHLYQGPLGAIWVLAFGLTFSLAYVVSKQLWPPVLAHILWDLVPIYASGG